MKLQIQCVVFCLCLALAFLVSTPEISSAMQNVEVESTITENCITKELTSIIDSNSRYGRIKSRNKKGAEKISLTIKTNAPLYLANVDSYIKSNEKFINSESDKYSKDFLTNLKEPFLNFCKALLKHDTDTMNILCKGNITKYSNKLFSIEKID